ncbi:hypothetical protein SALBM135S_03866 [Streptomyces alboniger]
MAPGVTPAARSRRATRSDSASRPAYVRTSSPLSTAGASGMRAARAANRPVTVAGPGGGAAGAPYERASSSRCSSAGSTSMRSAGVAGSPASPSKARTTRAATAAAERPYRQPTASSIRSPATTASVTG